MRLAPTDRIGRRPSLTPMIDVVFLLLVFFILVSRFDTEAALNLSLATGGDAIEGPPRLIDIAPDALRLNGIVVSETGIADALSQIGVTGDSVIVVRPGQGVDVQRLVAVIEQLSAAGFARVSIFGEGP